MEAVRRQHGVKLEWSVNGDVLIEQDELGETQIVVVTPESVQTLIMALQRFVAEGRTE